MIYSIPNNKSDIEKVEEINEGQCNWEEGAFFLKKGEF